MSFTKKMPLTPGRKDAVKIASSEKKKDREKESSPKLKNKKRSPPGSRISKFGSMGSSDSIQIVETPGIGGISPRRLHTRSSFDNDTLDELSPSMVPVKFSYLAGGHLQSRSRSYSSPDGFPFRKKSASRIKTEPKKGSKTKQPEISESPRSLKGRWGFLQSRTSKSNLELDMDEKAENNSELMVQEILTLRNHLICMYIKHLPEVKTFGPDNCMSAFELPDSECLEAPPSDNYENFSPKAKKRPQDIRQSSMFSTLFQAAPGWQIEMNFNNAAPHAYHIDLARWYTDYFYKNEHVNVLGKSEQHGPIVVSIMKQHSESMNLGVYRVLVRTKEATQSVLVPQRILSQVEVLELNRQLLAAVDPDISSLPYSVVLEEKFKKDLLDFEIKQVPNRFKFGILCVREGQTREEEMFRNQTIPNSPFEDFLDFIGQRIALKGFDKFSGGLDTTDNTTGAFSLYNVWNGNEIMFHVSTLLPYSSSNPQQVERKRHIGNDIVLIVFNEGVSKFVPSTVLSQFIHVIIALSVAETDAHGHATSYHISVASQNGVPWFGPRLPRSGILPKNEVSFNFLMYKLINAELAAYRAPQFCTRLERAREMILSDMLTSYGPKV